MTTWSVQNLNKKIEGLDLIAFDLDYTLWPFFVDCSDPPFKKAGKHVVDACGGKVKPYPDSTNILQRLSSLGYKIAIASRTSAVKEAKELINLFGWKQYINYQEIYPGCKVTHFTQFKKESKIPFDRMIFFDDEERNIVDINRLGSVAILVKRGVNNTVVAEGLDYFVRVQNQKQ
ncbi:Magnesium-dependent phosphatase 1 [Pseudolycoriella hygida]|uniref:Magnesium-dependent phosphatase 1 n=1 Tax=Pseudolycoriella hygida TaxID=35572 RepID=A0A9Q0RY66_9DIPT|nr:Magnesium-dependent phosphatase 1 [Pseudolycoriella hygida]